MFNKKWSMMFPLSIKDKYEKTCKRWLFTSWSPPLIDKLSSNNIIFFGKFKWKDTIFIEFTRDLWGNKIKDDLTFLYIFANFELVGFEEAI